MGFQRNYDNVVRYLLQEPGGQYRNYNELILNNTLAFEEQYSTIRRTVDRTDSVVFEQTLKNGSTETCYRDIRLVEPRDFLHLLNYIETFDTRFVYVPRPFHRSNLFSLTTLVRLNDSSVLGCIVCGKKSSYEVGSEHVTFTTLSLIRPNHQTKPLMYSTWGFSVPWSDIDDMYTNDTDPEHQTYSSKPVFEQIHYLHHPCCPVVWLQRDDNAMWNYKNAPFTMRGPSKFQHIVQFLTTYPLPRENMMWLSFANKVGSCLTPGAMQQTIENLLRIVCHERLKISVARLYNCNAERCNSSYMTKTTVGESPVAVACRCSRGSVLNVLRVTCGEQQSTPSVDEAGGPEHCLLDPSDTTTTVDTEATRGTAERINHDRVAYARNTNTSEGTQAAFHREPVHVNLYAYETINLYDDNPVFDRPYGYQLAELLSPRVLPVGGSTTVIPLTAEQTLSAKLNRFVQSSDAPGHRPFSPQNRFCEKCTHDKVARAFKDGTVMPLYYHRLLFLHGYLIPRRGAPTSATQHRPTVDAHVCLYCCAVFANDLMNYDDANVYFTPHRATLLLKYALYGCKPGVALEREVFGRRLAPVHPFPFAFFKDLNTTVLPPRLDRTHDTDCRLQQALVWLSATLDTLHKNDCVFRVKKRVFDCVGCRVCLDDSSGLEKCMMSCGHWICSSCYEQIAITDCCICKRGNRTGPIKISEGVLKGYAESAHFAPNSQPAEPTTTTIEVFV